MRTGSIQFRTYESFIWTTMIGLFSLSSVSAVAETWLAFPPNGTVETINAKDARTPWVNVFHHDQRGMKLQVRFAHLSLSTRETESGEFVELSGIHTPVFSDTGTPALPVVRRLFAVPIGTEVSVKVEQNYASVVDLVSIGFESPVYPAQGPASLDMEELHKRVADGKSGALADLLPDSFQLDEQIYTTDEFSPSAAVSIQPSGTVRGFQLYVLEARSVAYNPVRNAIAVWPELDIRLNFDGWDSDTASPARWLNKVILNPVPLTSPPDRDPENYFVICAPIFVDSAPLNQLLARKTDQGYNVIVWEPPARYTSIDIDLYIETLWGTVQQPDAILVVGDSYNSIVIDGCIPVRSGHGPEHYWGDVPFASMEGQEDWFPDVPIGRLTARTVEELQEIVDKILYVEASDFADPSYTQRATFICGSDTYSGGKETHEEIISTYMEPEGITPQRIYAIDGGTPQDVSNAFNTGTFLATYFGHAAGHQAWGDPLFYLSDIEALTNENLYPFLISFSCSPGSFWGRNPDTNDPGWLEAWVKAPNKGATAGYGPGGQLHPYTWDTWQNRYRFLYRAFYQDGLREIGEATLAASAYFVAFYGTNEPVSIDHTETFQLIGEPLMRLPEPPSKNLLIVTAQEYDGTTELNTFIAHKQSMGLNVSVYVVTPGTANTAIRDYIKSLWGTAEAPDYVLLVGDTSGSTATIDTIPHFIGGGDKQAATDWPYGCMGDGDDWYPEIPVGRFSVTSPNMLGVQVDKTICVESGVFPDPDYVKRGAFLANPGTNGTAEPSHDFVIDTYFTPNDYVGNRLYAAQGANTQDVIDAVNAGSMWTVYYGHSSSNGWWDPSFNTSHISSLSNQGMYGIACGWSCNTAKYTLDECFGEAWVRAPNKGSAVYISASAYIYWGSVENWQPSVVQERSFFASFFEDDLWNVGDAWLAGQYRFLADYGGWDGDPAHPPTQNQDKVRNFLEEFVILGDPSLQVPRPYRFALSTVNDTVSACIPGDTQVSYLIHIDALGGFSDPVHLAVLNLPQGTSATFDLNDTAPPFSSVLTIDGVDSLSWGTYNFVLRGTSTSPSLEIPLSLVVSDEMPGVPVLSQPVDGAEQVSQTPTLIWQDSTGAAEYYVEVSSDPSFNNIPYSTTTAETSVIVSPQLAIATTYWWRVRSTNACNSSEFSSAFTFTTAAQADYFTEQFNNSFDLAGHTMKLTPNGLANFYEVCLEAATDLPTDPTGGQTVSLSDDHFAFVSVPGNNSVYVYGTPFAGFYIGSNGFITFDAGDGDHNETIADHFSLKRISALFHDFNPSSGGTVSWKDTGDHIAVTWENIPEFGTNNSNTFQIEMFYDGVITITWTSMDANDGIVGISNGDGVPSDFHESDLSLSPICTEPATGACCSGTKCSIMTENACVVSGGSYIGDDTTCDVNPCIEYDTSCLIISEVVKGMESGGCPRWIEITNTSKSDFAFTGGGLIVQTQGPDDLYIDINLSGVVIPSGYSFVIVSNANGTCTGAFDGVYGASADFYTNVPFGFGDECFLLTNDNDASNIIDIYGRMGADGTGKPWEYTDGYSFRLPEWTGSMGHYFADAEWMFGGVGSLDGENPTALLLQNTTPGHHQFDGFCFPHVFGDVDANGVLNLEDLTSLTYCLFGPDTDVPQSCAGADLTHDGDVDVEDFTWFQEELPNP